MAPSAPEVLRFEEELRWASGGSMPDAVGGGWHGGCGDWGGDAGGGGRPLAFRPVALYASPAAESAASG